MGGQRIGVLGRYNGRRARPESRPGSPESPDGVAAGLSAPRALWRMGSSTLHLILLLVVAVPTAVIGLHLGLSLGDPTERGAGGDRTTARPLPVLVIPDPSGSGPTAS